MLWRRFMTTMQFGQEIAAYLLRQERHVFSNEVIACWMVQNREAPWISESDQV